MLKQVKIKLNDVVIGHKIAVKFLDNVNEHLSHAHTVV